MNTSFAGSNEKLEEFKNYQINTFDKKISEIKINTLIKGNYWDQSTKSCKISIKDLYKNKYKIKSIDIKYYDYDNFKSRIKSFKLKNKNSFFIRPENDISIEKISINYKTNGKVKKETTKFGVDNSWKKNNLL